MYKSVIYLLCALTLSPLVSAEESEHGFKSNWEFGVIGVLDLNPDVESEAGLVLGYDIQYKNLFIDKTVIGGGGRTNFGYRIVNNESHSFDFIALSRYTLIQDLLYNDEFRYDYTEDEKNEYLEQRRATHRPFGFRYTGHFDRNLIQFNALTDPWGETGEFASLLFVRKYMVKNWGLNGIGLMNYHSQAYNRAYFGVSEQEATRTHPEYSPTESVNLFFGVVAERPLNKNWIFRAGVQQMFASKALQDASLYDEPDQAIFTLISYVF